jgi:hypothetical protein
MKCPEEHIETDLLLEWQEKDGKKVLSSVSCDNSKLMDLTPQDCEWSCWEVVEKKKS